MTKMEQMWHDGNRQKYGMDGLQLEKETSKPNYAIEDRKAKPLQADRDRQQYLRDKYNMPNGVFACEGLLGVLIENRVQSLADRVIEDDRRRSAGMKLCLARVEFQGKKMLLGIEHTKF